MLDAKITRGGMVGSQIVRDQNLRHEAIFLQELPHQFERRCLIPLGLDQDVQNFSFAIDGAPEIDQASIDFRWTSSRCQTVYGLGLWLRRSAAIFGPK